MSYARFGSQGSDVYVYAGTDAYHCCGCALEGREKFPTTRELVEHLRDHQTTGHVVPEDTFAHLKAEGEENEDFFRRGAK